MLPPQPGECFYTQRYIIIIQLLSDDIIRSTAVRHDNTIVVISDPYVIFRCVLKCL